MDAYPACHKLTSPLRQFGFATGSIGYGVVENEILIKCTITDAFWVVVRYGYL